MFFFGTLLPLLPANTIHNTSNSSLLGLWLVEAHCCVYGTVPSTPPLRPLPLPWPRHHHTGAIMISLDMVWEPQETHWRSHCRTYNDRPTDRIGSVEHLPSSGGFTHFNCFAAITRTTTKKAFVKNLLGDRYSDGTGMRLCVPPIRHSRTPTLSSYRFD